MLLEHQNVARGTRVPQNTILILLAYGNARVKLQRTTVNAVQSSVYRYEILMTRTQMSKKCTHLNAKHMRGESMHEGMCTGDNVTSEMTMRMQCSKLRSVFRLHFRIRCYMYGIRIKADVLANDVILVAFNSDRTLCYGSESDVLPYLT